MSTNSTIIVQHPETGALASIYCHWDGYLSHNGKILLENYTTHDKVMELIQLGNLSELHPTIDATVSYHKWRGEDLEIDTSPIMDDHTDFEYAYLFKDGKWFYKNGGNVFRELTLDACIRDE